MNDDDIMQVTMVNVVIFEGCTTRHVVKVTVEIGFSKDTEQSKISSRDYVHSTLNRLKTCMQIDRAPHSLNVEALIFYAQTIIINRNLVYTYISHIKVHV